MRPSGIQEPESDQLSAFSAPVEEGIVRDPDTLPKPAGFGTEDTTSNTSWTLIDEYTVDDLHLAHLREASLSIPANAQAKVTVAGVTYGPYTGAVDVTIPIDPGVLTQGYEVRVFHQSTDGSSVTTLAQLVVLEV